MRFLWVLFGLLLPLSGIAAPICPAGFILNNLYLCEKKWDLLDGHCPQGSYYDSKVKDCIARCPYRSTAEMSEAGDVVCQKDNKREWLEGYQQKCAAMGARYQPQIDMCIAPPSKPQPKQEITTCPKGKVWRVTDGNFSCVKGNPKRVIQQLEERLHNQGLTYMQYLEAIKDIQTDRFAAEVLNFRWEEATGVRQTQEQKDKAVIEATKCPDQYMATAEGGCIPQKSCGSYSCPAGQVSRLATQGKNQFCQCEPVTP